MTERTHFLYRVWDEFGVLLYIGCSKGPETRWVQHRTERQPWVKYGTTFRLEGPYPKGAAFKRETAAIAAERPAFNALTEHRRSQRMNYQVAERLRNESRRNNPELWECLPGTLGWDNLAHELDRCRDDADRESPAVTPAMRLALYLVGRRECESQPLRVIQGGVA